jgi:hypothetical protein
VAIYTSRFYNPELKTGKYTTVRIALGSPKWDLGYVMDGAINDLMPNGLFKKYDHDRAAFEREYRKNLDRIGADKILRQLIQYERKGKDVVLLCYEDVRKPGDWCHRTMFAAWWTEKTGEVIEELTDPVTIKPPKTPITAKTAKDAAPQVDSLQMTLFQMM